MRRFTCGHPATHIEPCRLSTGDRKGVWRSVYRRFDAAGRASMVPLGWPRSAGSILGRAAYATFLAKGSLRAFGCGSAWSCQRSTSDLGK